MTVNAPPDAALVEGVTKPIDSTTVSASGASLRMIGHVPEVHGPVVDVTCQTLPPLRRMLEVAIDGRRAVLDVLHHLDAGRLRAIALDRTAGLRPTNRTAGRQAPESAWRARCWA